MSEPQRTPREFVPLTEEEKIERRKAIARMVALREKAITEGMELLDRDGVNALLRERRGGVASRDEDRD